MKSLITAVLAFLPVMVWAQAGYENIDKKCAPKVFSRVNKDTVAKARDLVVFNKLSESAELIPYKLRDLAENPHPGSVALNRVAIHQSECLREALEEKIGAYSNRNKLLAELQGYQEHLYRLEYQGRAEKFKECRKVPNPEGRHACWSNHFTERLYIITMRDVLEEMVKDINVRNKFGEGTTMTGFFRQRRDAYLDENKILEKRFGIHLVADSTESPYAER